MSHFLFCFLLSVTIELIYFFEFRSFGAVFHCFRSMVMMYIKWTFTHQWKMSPHRIYWDVFYFLFVYTLWAMVMASDREFCPMNFDEIHRIRYKCSNIHTTYTPTIYMQIVCQHRENRIGYCRINMLCVCASMCAKIQFSRLKLRNEC